MCESSVTPGDHAVLRIAVLGAGAHSQYCHGPALRAIAAARSDIELAAVCDLDGARARSYAEAFGFARAYDDPDAMLGAEKIDGIIAVTPLLLTASIVTRLLPLGIPLLLEKPPGRDSGETRQLISVAERTGTPHMISFNRRFSPAIGKARAWMAHAGRPAKVVLARMLRVNRQEADFVTGTGIHLIDAVNSLLGEPVHVAAANIPAAVAGACFTQAAVTYASGSRAHLVISPVCGSGEETYEIHGEDFTIHIDTIRCAMSVWEGGETVMHWSAPEDSEAAFRDGTVNETAAFIAALAGTQPFAPTLHEGLSSMLTAEAVARGGESELPAASGSRQMGD